MTEAAAIPSEPSAPVASPVVAPPVDPAAVAPAAIPAPPARAHREATPPGDCPADGRQQYAGDDPKKLSRLERYASPKAALDALFAAQQRISSGELKAALSPDATPE